MCRGHASSGVAAIHDVVMDEGARLEQLEGRGSGDRLLAVGAASAAPPPVGERWPQSLAASAQVDDGLGKRGEVGADLVEKRNLGVEEVIEPLLNPDT